MKKQSNRTLPSIGSQLTLIKAEKIFPKIIKADFKGRQIKPQKLADNPRNWDVDWFNNYE